MSSYYFSKAPLPLAAAAAVVCFKELVGDSRESTCRPEVKTGQGIIQRGPIGCSAYTCGAGSLSTTTNPLATGNATCCCSASRLQQLRQEEGASRAAVNEVAGGRGEGLLGARAGEVAAVLSRNCSWWGQDRH